MTNKFKIDTQLPFWDHLWEDIMSSDKVESGIRNVFISPQVYREQLAHMAFLGIDYTLEETQWGLKVKSEHGTATLARHLIVSGFIVEVVTNDNEKYIYDIESNKLVNHINHDRQASKKRPH